MGQARLHCRYEANRLLGSGDNVLRRSSVFDGLDQKRESVDFRRYPVRADRLSNVRSPTGQLVFASS